MKQNKLVLSVISVGLILVTSCDFFAIKDTPELDLVVVQVDTTLFDDVDAKFEKEDSIMDMQMVSTLKKGSTWRLWRNIHLDCMKSEWMKSPFYFGVSNTLDLGSLVDKRFNLQRTLDSTSGFSNDDVKAIINYGNFNPCNVYREINVSLNTLLQSDFDLYPNSNPELTVELLMSLALKKKTEVKIENWRLNNLRAGVLEDQLIYAEEGSQKSRFYNSMKKKGFYILSKVIEIKGFSSIVELDKEVSPALKAKLKEGLRIPLSNSEAELRFTFKNNTTIEISSSGSFYVFGEFKKAKHLIN